MSEKLPMIVNGNFSFGYYETSNKKEVEQYNEVDLGELFLINRHTNLFDKCPEKGNQTVKFTDLDIKASKYHRDAGLLQKAETILNKLKIGSYTSDERIVSDFDKLFPELLKAGHYLKGTKTACLLKSVIPVIDHTDFEFFFASKLYLVSKKLSRIDKFLDFQLQQFLKREKSTTDFKRCLKLAVRQYAKEFDFSEQALKTIEEWAETAKETTMDGLPEHSQNIEIRWANKGKVDLIKFIYAAFKLGKINDGKGEIGEIIFEILRFFGHTLKKGDNSHSNNVNQKIRRGGHPEEFFDDLKKAYLEYLDDPHCFKR